MRRATSDSEAEFRREVGRIGDELLQASPDLLAARSVIEVFGKRGLIAARWTRTDDLYGVAIIDELAVRGLSSSAVVMSLHSESVIAMLRQFAPVELRDTLNGALAGTSVGCVAASEPGGGSDLLAVETTASRLADGWHLQGEKRFVTLATEADFAIVLARIDGTRSLAQLGAFVVPRTGYEIVKTHRLVAASKLDTSWVRIDATVPTHHLLGRSGLGLAVINWGLTKERLAVAALVVGTCQLAISLAITHAMRRYQFGRRLFDHQAIRLRLADLDSQLQALRSDVRHLATTRGMSRRTAGLKVTAARFGERCTSECMHVFGGDGYIEDETPLGRLWRDLRLARIGGGTDEMMWEIVASGMAADDATYRLHIRSAKSVAGEV